MRRTGAKAEKLSMNSAANKTALYANSTGFQYEQAFCRNLGLVTREEQETLRQATIAIPGMGGVGGIHLMTLARMGVGGFHVSDEDSFGLANFNRQYGAKVSTLGQPKVDVMCDLAMDVNPQLRLSKWAEFIDEKNVERFLSGCDVVVDSLDAYATGPRRMMFMKAREMGIPVVTAGPIGFSCALLIFTPESMSYDQYFNYNDTMGPEDQFLWFVMGLTPSPYFLRYMNTRNVDMGERRGPCIASSVALCAGFAAVEVLKLLLGRGKVCPVPHYHCFDPYLMKFKRGYLPFGNRNPWQRLKHFLVKKFIFKR